MENTDNLNNQLDSFLNPVNKNEEDIVITPKTGLIERVDKKLVTQDGRQLLREVRFDN